MIRPADDTRQYLVDVLKATAGFVVVTFVYSIVQTTGNSNDSNVAKSLLDQSSRWYKMSLQDKNPIFSMQHLNYALAYLNAARSVSNDTNLERVSGIDVHKLSVQLDKHHLHVLREVSEKSHVKLKQKEVHNQTSWLH